MVSESFVYSSKVAPHGFELSLGKRLANLSGLSPRSNTSDHCAGVRFHGWDIFILSPPWDRCHLRGNNRDSILLPSRFPYRQGTAHFCRNFRKTRRTDSAEIRDT